MSGSKKPVWARDQRKMLAGFLTGTRMKATGQFKTACMLGGRISGQLNGPDNIRVAHQSLTTEIRRKAGEKGGRTQGRKNVQSGLIERMNHVRLHAMRNLKVPGCSHCQS